MRRVAVYAGTRNVYGMMAAAAKSLLAHTHMDVVYFLIEDDAFPEPLPDVVRVWNMAKWSGNGEAWFLSDGPNYSSQWTWMSLIRLVLPELFVGEKRVLWLDVDTIVEQDVGEIFDRDLAGNYVAMVEEPVRSKYPFTYHNAGVILMDLDKLRADDTWRKWIKLINREPFTAKDQDVINLICQGEILTLGPEWNSAGHITQNAEDPYIRHYAGCLRPSGVAAIARYEKAEWRVK
jgi:lipopolysaccharide biosynthesis glycosyltransferase